MKLWGMARPDLVDELEAAAARQRLDAQEDLAELAGAAGLLLVPVVALGGRRWSRGRRCAAAAFPPGSCALRSGGPAACAGAARPGRRPPSRWWWHVFHAQAGSSLTSFSRMSCRRCSSPRRLGVMASPCTGTGKSSGFRWMRASSAASCSTASKCSSSTFAIAQMSPGTAFATSFSSLPCSMKRWPTLKGRRPSPTYSWLSRVMVPWCTRITPSCPRRGPA